MSSVTASTAQELKETEREELLRQAAQRSMVFREVMRHAVQELRSTLAADCPTVEGMGDTSEKTRSPFGESQFRILRCLVRDGPLTVSQVAESCRVSVPAISRMLNHLETTGLIERHVDATNRRVIHVVVTDAGRAAEVELNRRIATALEHVLNPLTEAELADLITAFGHLERLVTDADSAPCPVVSNQ